MDGTPFHPLVRTWFARRFGAPTKPQLLGWPEIAAGRHTLIAAPTGSGKTLAAFLVCIDRLWREAQAGTLPSHIDVVYVSPLKALSNDIERNLRGPLAELTALAEAQGSRPPQIRAAVRTGDTPASERQAMLRRPPQILVTTPESLYILLTSAKSRELLRQVRTVIVDEIHALARDKRGSHLTLSLERLAALTDRPPTRIGLSATQRPLSEIAAFLVGGEETPVSVVDVGHLRELDLGIEVPPSDLSAVCSHEQWEEVYERLCQQIAGHRSTLLFVNTRRMAERIGHQLRERLGEDAVASHHGSLSKEIRLAVEQRLKDGQLRAIVATASLEMGIDIGYLDLVCQIGSPRSIAAFLQRIGRSGHSLRAIPCGRLFPLTRDDLIECLALLRAVRGQRLDRIEIPVAPLDILAQQIVAEVASRDCAEEDLFALFRRAAPYRNLARAEFEQIVTLLSEGTGRSSARGAWLHRDRIHGMLRARPGARLAAVTSGGAIPDTAEYRVVLESDGTFVGKLDEDFAIESMAGDIFLLGNSSWRVQHVRAGEVVVSDAAGAPPTIPFWLGEGLGRTRELSEEVSRLRRELASRIAANEAPTEIAGWLQAECGVADAAARQAVDYVTAQQLALGVVPTAEQIVFERFFDESGGMQLVIHAPLGQRINRAWGLALRKRFCRSFDFELQAAANDNAILLSLSPQHSFPIDSLFKMIQPHNGHHLLEQAVLAQPVFQVRWRWNAVRALQVLRQQGGRKVAPHLLRFRAEDLLAAAFPETVGCFENHHGDMEIPNHPLVQQTMRDCLHEALDETHWVGLLEKIQTGEVRLEARETREPSPFCQEILNSNPYTFLDDAPLEERRTRAIATRRSFPRDEIRELARLDPVAVEQIREEVRPAPRTVEELHDLLQRAVLLREDEVAPWQPWAESLALQGRAARVTPTGSRFTWWLAAERWPWVRAAYPGIGSTPELQLPAALEHDVTTTAAVTTLVGGRLTVSGPLTAGDVAHDLGLTESTVFAALEAVEASGAAMRGHFICSGNESAVQWCDRRYVARMQRLTLERLRQRIQPVTAKEFLHFLAHRHRLLGNVRWTSAAGVREVIEVLEGFEAPAGAWEHPLLASRVVDYDPAWLDSLFQSGDVLWGRLRQPPESDAVASRSALTRVVPISLLLRDHQEWLLQPPTPDGGGLPDRLAGLRPQTRQVWELLQTRGALFTKEILSKSGMLPGHLDAALRELAARGLVTADGFGAVRSLAATGKSPSRSASGAGVGVRLSQATGRWSLFPGDSPAQLSPRERLEHWIRLLLRRYGVLFRDLLVRESTAPSWSELVPILRVQEMRGELRGGRFVAGVSGEQYAEEGAVEKLRSMRDLLAGESTGEDWLLVSATDPLNLCGIVDDHPRVAATLANSLILRHGEFVAIRQGKEVTFLTELPVEEQANLRRALLTGRRTPTLHIPAGVAGATAGVSPVRWDQRSTGSATSRSGPGRSR